MHFFGSDALRNYKEAGGPVEKGHSQKIIQKKAMSILPSLPQPIGNSLHFVLGHHLNCTFRREKRKMKKKVKKKR